MMSAMLRYPKQDCNSLTSSLRPCLSQPHLGSRCLTVCKPHGTFSSSLQVRVTQGSTAASTVCVCDSSVLNL
jgi:hypothetical protein